MLRNSDMVRTGKIPDPAAQRPPQREQAAPDAPESEGVSFSDIPHIKQAPQRTIKDFPVFSQLYNEIGTIAEVVEQINRISDFISGRATTPAPSPPAQPAPEPQQTAPQRETPAPPTVREPPPEKSAPAQQPATEVDIQNLYEHLMHFVETAMQAIQAGRSFAVDQGFLLISQAVSVPGALDELYRRAIYTRETLETHGFTASVVLHSVNVAIYAIKIGHGLGYNRNQLIDLGASGLLHDVGMVTLSPDLFTKGRFTQNDIALLQQHPAKGRDMLLKLGEKYQWLADVAYQEHEREDGSGYPQKLMGNDIHEYAKIIGVADIYAGLTRSRPDRHGMLPFEAVKEILQTRKHEFDPRVVRVLLKTLSAFPVGSLVKLNSGAIGRVTDTDIDSPLRPVISILYDPEGRPVREAREIRLREHPILHITDTVAPEEVGLS